MVKSPLSPERIAKTNNKNLEGALKFVSGGSPLGSSVVSNAANKIVGFNREKVSPKQTNFKSLIETLTSNIFNNISSIQNIFNNKPEKKEKGMSFFSGMFDKAKEALGFVRFFGEKKNLDKIKDSLNNLKDTFSETFEVAKALRKAIVKIFKELSGIDTSGGGKGGGLIGGILSAIGGLLGGLIPGRKGTRGLEGAKGARALEGEGNIFSKIPKMMKGGGGGIGKLLLGGGLVAGGMALSGLSAGPGDTEFQPGETQTEVPGDLLDKFNSILDRFDKVLDGLLKGGKGPKGSSSGAKSSDGGTSPSGATPGPTFTPTPTGQITGSQAEKETKMFSYLKGQLGENAATGILANSMRESGYRTNAPEGGFQGMFQWDATRWNSLTSWAKSKGLNPMDNGTQLQYALIEAKQSGIMDELKSAKTPQEAASIWYNKFERAAYSKAVQGSAYRPDNPHEKLNLQYAQQILQRQKGTAAAQIPSTAPILLAPQQIAQTQGLAVQRKQGQGNVNVISVPGQQEASAQPGGSQLSAPPSPAKSGPTMPFLLAANTDNFLNLYSRMVYNIIDG